MVKPLAGLRFGVSLCIVAALLIAFAVACAEQEEEPAPAPAPTAAAAPAPPTAAPAPAAPAPAPAAMEGPQYGGTYTYGGISLHWTTEPKSWDTSQGGDWAMFCYSHYYQSVMLTGDIDTFGPRGSNEYDFNHYEAVPPQFLRGDLAESYTIDESKIVFKMRDDVMWRGNEKIGMEPRKLTAHDVAFTHNYFFNGKILEGYYDFVDKMYAEDDTTFVVETNRFNFLWDWPLAWGVGMYPPEVMEAGAEDWENQVSSGPFVLTEFTKGSQVVYEKNPDYYGVATIDGKEYQLPFIDKLVLPIIHDDSAKIAAIRTAKLDTIESLAPEFKESIEKSSPDIVWHRWLTGGSMYVAFKSSGDSRFADRDLRRAMAVGTDRNAIRDTVYLGEGDVHSVFGPGSTIHTPLEQLPEDAKVLFGYDPESAKQMLADVGYPDGLEMELWFNAGDPKSRDIADLLKEQWTNMGVDATLIPIEDTAFGALRSNHEYNDAMLLGDGVEPIEFLDKQPGTVDNAPDFSEPYWKEEFIRAGGIVDNEERNKALAQLAIYYVSENPYMQLTAPYNYTAWWPWVKNYFGETDTGFVDTSHIISRLWIDQDLKKSLGK